MRNHIASSVAVWLLGLMLYSCATTEQTSQREVSIPATPVPTTPGPSPSAAQGSPQAAVFRSEEIEQLVAPVALYPDALLAQVLMASTYPLEIVAAARWLETHQTLQGQALEDALHAETWDPSVKSLAAFPQVLTMMDEKLDWTQKLGDAFLAQQKDVMDAVQRLRAKAHAEGNLQTTQEQKVIVEQPAGSQTMVVEIEPADPQVVYVPTYDPTVVYGAWPYPAYPPYYWYPPGYGAAASFLSFGVGVAVGSALWGDFDWHGRDVDIDVNKFNNFNKTNITNRKWEHNVEHRKGVQYREQLSQQKFNRTTHTGGDTREAFRGRAESGWHELARANDEGRRRDVKGGRLEAERRDRPGAERSRQANAFEGLGNGREVRRDSDRGRASVQSAAASRAAHSAGGGHFSRGGVAVAAVMSVAGVAAAVWAAVVGAGGDDPSEA